MSSRLEISRFEGGWAVKLWDTGEVLFFTSGRQARREADRLAAQARGEVRIEVHDLGRELRSEWASASALASGR
ncbi:hypothetical protein [Caulobacter endophyticus]|uniref:hypothetical protein n=1 Tax=Caulobacter endophyticus TaxID=2172652 RepID=UPI00241001D3|nr:hypothetical protein [Caulobacter endophyticus]MDG2528987.1 hypothetical protein [Caulobacter endophyticus]